MASLLYFHEWQVPRRTTVGLAGCAPRFVPNRGHPALIPDASGP